MGFPLPSSNVLFKHGNLKFRFRHRSSVCAPYQKKKNSGPNKRKCDSMKKLRADVRRVHQMCDRDRSQKVRMHEMCGRDQSTRVSSQTSRACILRLLGDVFARRKCFWRLVRVVANIFSRVKTTFEQTLHFFAEGLVQLRELSACNLYGFCISWHLRGTPVLWIRFLSA